MARRKIIIELSVEEEEYERAMDLVITSLFKGSPWLPGFLFQTVIKGWSLGLNREPK